MKCPYCYNGPLGTPKNDMVRNTMFFQCDGGVSYKHALIQYFPQNSTYQTKDYKMACFFIVHGYKMEQRGDTYFLTK